MKIDLYSRKLIIFTLGDEVPLYGRETELCEEPNAGDCGPTLANDVFVNICGDWDRRLGTGLGPTGVTDGFHVLVPPLEHLYLMSFTNNFLILIIT